MASQIHGLGTMQCPKEATAADSRNKSGVSRQRRLLLDAGEGVEQVVIERGGHAETGLQVVDELRAADGGVVLAVAAEIEALVVVPRADGLGLVRALGTFVCLAFERENVLLVEPVDGLEECLGVVIELRGTGPSHRGPHRRSPIRSGTTSR